MVYGNLVMEICRVYELDLEEWEIQNNIEYNVIESKVLSNDYFLNMHCEDKSKLGKYIRLKKGEVRTQGPKVQL